MSTIFSPKNILIFLAIVAIIIFSRIFFPVPLPAIILAAEVIPGFTILGFPITNTQVALWIAEITVLVIGWLAVRKREMVPGRLQSALEWAFEFFYNQGNDLVGDRTARAMMPLAMTIFVVILACNWWGRIPGFEAIGVIEKPHVAGVQTWKTKQLLPGLYTIIAEPGPVTSEADAKAAAALSVAPETEPAHRVPEYGTLIPWLRATTTDLNFTIALALIAFVYIQYRGIRANGFGGYLHKFFNFSGFIPAFVGLLELVSEFAKIISFSFRLFGNIFAGTVLVFVMSFLLPWLVPIPFAGLEIFIGFIQALVFALLVIVFSAGAMESHEHHPEIPVADTDAAETAAQAMEAVHHHAPHKTPA